MNFERPIALLATTAGRDKLLKAAGGATRVLFQYTENKSHGAVTKGISEARSLMRLAGWTQNIQKLRAMWAKRDSLPFQEKLMALRVLLDMGYCVLDNMQYFKKYNLLPLVSMEHAKIVHRSILFMFWGFLTAAIIDVLTFMNMAPVDRITNGPARLGMLVRNSCDCLAALSNSKLLPAAQFSQTTVGVLALISGLISTKENWDATKKKKA